MYVSICLSVMLPFIILRGNDERVDFNVIDTIRHELVCVCNGGYCYSKIIILLCVYVLHYCFELLYLVIC